MTSPEVAGTAEARWMAEAVALGKQSISEDERPLPRVGAIAVLDGKIVASGFRGKTGPGEHAEFGMVKGLEPGALAGAAVFTTLEPCSRRGPGKVPCAQRLIDAGVGAVYVGIYDPNPAIYRLGWRMLRDAGVVLRDFSPKYRHEIVVDNDEFLNSFRSTVGLRESIRFDYSLNGGNFEIRHGEAVFKTHWSNRGPGSIYAVDYQHHVAQARYAKQFFEVDDPGALDFSNYTVPLNVGDIGVFRTGEDFLLVKVHEVVSDASERRELALEYEIRSAEPE